MFPSSFSNTGDSLQTEDFEQLIQDAIIAVKNGNRTLARRLLNQAALINPADARLWIWLSATTDDMQERRNYLERAVAIDPSNATAKRGLLIISEKLDKSKLMPEGAAYVPEKAPAAVEAVCKTYTCPNCGASISYDVREITLVCQFCGFTRKIDQQLLSESSDQPLDNILPTSIAHRWADTQTRVTCEQCGVTILLPPGQTADSCPYCGSNRFVSSPTLVELVDPQKIGLFKIDPSVAARNVKSWLGKGLLSPDDLAARHAGIQLHPAYYPFWIFDGTLEVPWFCDLNIGTGKAPLWEAHSGSQFEMFSDVLVPGLKKLTAAELAGLEPFNLKDLVEFSPDFLAGWIALTYDHALADASLRAREKILKKVKPTLYNLVEPGKPKRNFTTGAGKWSGLSYKLVLLPIYTGNLLFQGNRYRLLINGQTGAVTGKKPTDTLKLAMFSVTGLIVLAILLTILIVVLKGFMG